MKDEPPYEAYALALVNSEGRYELKETCLHLKDLEERYKEFRKDIPIPPNKEADNVLLLFKPVSHRQEGWGRFNSRVLQGVKKRLDDEIMCEKQGRPHFPRSR